MSVEGFRETARVTFQDTAVAARVFNAIAAYDAVRSPRRLDFDAPVAHPAMAPALASLDAEQAISRPRLAALMAADEASRGSEEPETGPLVIPDPSLLASQSAAESSGSDASSFEEGAAMSDADEDA